VLRSQQKYLPANGVGDPAGTYYLRFWIGPKLTYQRVGPDFHDAELAQHLKIREMDAASRGYVLPPEETPDIKKSHRIADVISAYLADLKESRRAPAAIEVKKSELNQFAKFCRTKIYVEQITRGDMIAYRNSLMDAGKKDLTVLNKLTVVLTWLRKNPVVSITGLMKPGSMKEGGDWPFKADSVPEPYSRAEQKALLDAAGEHQLLVWFLLSSGMRKMEVAHAEVEDIEKNYIRVQPKPKWGWSPKTRAGVRSIPLGTKIIKALKAHRTTGLLFPDEDGQPHDCLRIVQSIARRAGVKNTYVHRFRDSYASEQVEARKLDLRDIARHLGHRGLNMMRVYAAYVDLNSKRAREAGNLSNRLAPKSGLRLVKTPRLKEESAKGRRCTPRAANAAS
jgi:integrase